jgi:hypothetical protein
VDDRVFRAFDSGVASDSTETAASLFTESSSFFSGITFAASAVSSAGAASVTVTL